MESSKSTSELVTSFSEIRDELFKRQQLIMKVKHGGNDTDRFDDGFIDKTDKFLE